jgi:dienelactone hydrolase
VIASSAQGAHGYYMTDDLEGLEAQAADIRFLIGYANSLPQADSSRLAVIGYSWGGMASVLAAAKDSRIKALVNLDGSVRYYPDLVKSAGYLTPRTLTIPLLFLADKEDPIEPGKDVRPHSLINQLIYSDVYKVGMHPLTHEDFAADTLHFYTADDPAELPIAALSEGYGWMSRYVLEFLNAELKGDLTGRAFLNRSPAANGVPASVLSFQAQPHKATEVTLETFAARLNQQHFTHAVKLYAELRKVDPQFELTKTTLEPWGFTLLNQGQIAAAVEIFELQARLFPKDADAYGDLAYAQIANNDRALAIRNYRRSLQLAPGNTHRQRSLKNLMDADSHAAANAP